MNQKPIFSDLLSDEGWLIEQKGFQKPVQQVREAHFTLGNGMIGSRGVLEELPFDANAGTFVAGIFDRFGAVIPELVNLPNPIVFRADVGGEKLDPAAMEVLKHYRALDMYKGLLVRHTVYQTAHKKKIDYQSYRFISRYQRYIGVMVVAITPVDEAMTFNISSIIDTSVCNRGMLTEGRKKHFEVTDVSQTRVGTYTEVRTFEHRHKVGYASCLEVMQRGQKKIEYDRIFKIRIRKGETVIFTRYFTIVPSPYIRGQQVRKVAERELRRGKRIGVQRLLKANENAWKNIWDVTDIVIGGANNKQKAIRFNIYHLIIAGFKDERVSVGARTLSGEGYRGHIFWDSETFVFPFFVFVKPEIAKCMLMYRWHRLGYARNIASAKGYKGVLFPWESADTGEETTPAWFKDLTGDVLYIETMEEEHHLVADIAYAVHQYVEATGDYHFMNRYGLEILFETARFWFSRVTYNKKLERYEIYKIMGPDEFHKNTKNNAFTAEMARFNLEIAVGWYHWIRRHRSARGNHLIKKLGVTDNEIRKWHEVAEKIYVPYSKKKKIIEQFEGYLKLKDIRIRQLDQHFMPVIPPEALPAEEGKTQLIKQADVVMLLFMLRHKYTLDQMKRNFHYYEKRTSHKSSLSPAIHSIMAARIRAFDKALTYLSICLHADLHDIHGNADEGFHAASGGGVWQVMVMGFGGMRAEKDKIIFDPVLAPSWKSLAFKVFWRGALLSVKILKKETKIKRMGLGNQKEIMSQVYGNTKKLPVNKVVTFAIPKS